MTPSPVAAGAGARTGGQPYLCVRFGQSADVEGALMGAVPQPSATFEQGARSKRPALQVVEITRETCGHVSALLQQVEIGNVPDELLEGGLGNAFRAQFEGGVLRPGLDLLMLSLVPAATVELWRSRGEGYVIAPPTDWPVRWSSEQRAWFSERFEPLGVVEPDRFRTDLTRLVRAVKGRGAHVVVFNATTFNPAECAWNLNRDRQSLSLRVQALNLALMKVSRDEGVSIVDVDRVVAELGARNVVLGPLYYTERAIDAIRDELLRVVDDIGFFEERPLVPQFGAKAVDDDL